MNTIIRDIDERDIDWNIIEEAGAVIKAGGLVAFPTETVYGLGGDGLNAASAGKIYEAKGRPSDNPLIIHIARIEDLERIARDIPDEAYRLAERFWPGPLTMIFNKTDCVPLATTGGLSTVAVRMPDHQAALAFIGLAGGFVAAPSANVSGRPSPTMAKYVIEDMAGRIEMILDGGAVEIGLESTILDMTGKIPVILRPGYVTAQMLEAVVGMVESDRSLSKECQDERPRAPGMKYRHYAPRGSLQVVEGEAGSVIDYINDRVAADRAAGNKTGVIGTAETVRLYQADCVKSVGRREDQAEIGRRLYQILRECDEEEVDVIYAEAFSETGMGQAIMNRLRKAAGHHIINLKDREAKK